jgi:hypothetical protein
MRDEPEPTAFPSSGNQNAPVSPDAFPRAANHGNTDSRTLLLFWSKWISLTVRGLLIFAGTLYLASAGCAIIANKHFENAVPPSRVQTFADFVEWQPVILECLEVELRGVTYYHVVGPDARYISSGGAIYVFDAAGNFMGWSPDSGDIMRNEAVFYPEWWLPKESRCSPITLEQLKNRLSGRCPAE